MNMAFDIDGTISCGFHESIYQWVQLNKNYSGTYYDFWSRDWFCRDEIFKQFCIKGEMFYNTVFPSKSIVAFLQNLSVKNTLFYITSRPNSMQYVTAKWMGHGNFPNVENLFFSKNKAEIILDYDIKIMVEDNIEQYERLSSITKMFIINRPWNSEYIKKNNVQCLYNLEELGKYV